MKIAVVGSWISGLAAAWLVGRKHDVSLFESRARVDRVRALGFDDTFVHMWEFCLARCEAAFANRYLGTLQIALLRAGQSFGVRGNLGGERL